jgi:toxin YhaV
MSSRFRFFFRFDSKSRIIIFAWVNDESTLRSSDSKHDPYAVFQRMFARGNQPDDWTDLMVTDSIGMDVMVCTLARLNRHLFIEN